MINFPLKNLQKKFPNNVYIVATQRIQITNFIILLL